MWHVRCLWEVLCSIGPGSGFSFHCNFGVGRLLSASGPIGHALRFCSELPVEETLTGAGFEVRETKMETISTWRASGWSWDGNGIGGSVHSFHGDSQSASAK